MLSLNDPVHTSAIESLAQQMQVPVDRVADVYLAEWERLTADARIEDYLAVLTSKATKDILRTRRAELVAV